MEQRARRLGVLQFWEKGQAQGLVVRRLLEEGSLECMGTDGGAKDFYSLSCGGDTRDEAVLYASGCIETAFGRLDLQMRRASSLTNVLFARRTASGGPRI